MAHTTFHQDKVLVPAAVESEGSESKWSARKTLAFAVVASAALWALIILGVSALI